MPRIVQADRQGIEKAVAILRADGVVAFPTETVYGLGADTFNVQSVEQVYLLKGRPDDNPLIAHVSDVSTAKSLVETWDEWAQLLAQRFWPGPLTMVLPKAAIVPAQATAGLETIALRCPDHPVALELLRAFGGALSAPSANRSGRISSTTASHVAADFARVEDLLILDGGSCDVGVESTVLDLTSSMATILRPGRVGLAELQDVIGEVKSPQIESQASSPGTSLAHYAPSTTTYLVESNRLASKLESMTDSVVVLCFDATSIHPPRIAIPMPRDAEAYAQTLYDALREADAKGGEAIVIEQPSETSGLWSAIQDRLKRASCDS
ncbi:MAG: L-threonylcarbamoyladenylate synthase [Planctomycetota bacterium]|nr:L-threonylcarbamoyladenylate synthase [Planctomycetota bacterium]